MKSRWLFVFAALFFSPLAFSAGLDSIGDDTPTTSSAWFLGKRTIKVCYDLTADFGVAKGEVERSIEDAFSAWKDYYARKGPHFTIAKTKPFAFATTLLARCDGSEDLTFYFGTKDNPEVTKAKSHFTSPIAFAQQLSYDAKEGWGKGFIWVTGQGTIPVFEHFPNWSLPYLLEGTILHELGHVLGCGHVSGTAMMADLGMFLGFGMSKKDAARDYFTAIDGVRALIPSFYYDLEGQLSQAGVAKPEAGEAETFKRLTGRDPSGKITAHVTSTKDKPNRLVLSDAAGSQDFTLVYQASGHLDSGDVPLFKRSLEQPEEGGISSGWEVSMQSVQFATLTATDGKSYLVSRAWNMDYAPLTLLYFVDGKVKPLFTAKYSGPPRT